MALLTRHTCFALLLLAFASFASQCVFAGDEGGILAADDTKNGEAHNQRRRLKRIQALGGTPDPSHFPLQECEGDCDNNADCADGLVCFQKGTFTAVPGCEGGENDASKTDYCVKDSGSTPTPPATRRPTPAPQASTPKPTSHNGISMVHFLGNDGLPASVYPLPACGGDCDKDSDCAGNLVCFQRNRYDAVPGCTGGRQDSSTTDYCTHPSGGRPTPEPTMAPQMTPRPTLRPTQNPQAPHTGSEMIEFIGNNGNPSTVYPLGLCRGDCDNDQECLGNLVCYQRDSFQAVPGCLGGEGDSSKTDYCIQPPGGGPTPRPTPQATPRPTVMPTNRPTDRPTPAPQATAIIEFMGNDGIPAAVYPLGLCQGDCDNDQECLGNLVCYQRSGFERVPGCLGGEDDSSANDYCIPPPGGSNPTPSPRPTSSSDYKQIQVVGNDGSPFTAFPLQECEGDCDEDDDCDWGLYCFQRGRYDGVPGCSGGESESASSDFCAPLPPERQPLPDTFRLKLWWEEGYVWQEETFERKWCAMFDYDGYPGTGKCWYGLDAMDCNPEESYIAKCGNEIRQRFFFVKVNDEEVLIKLGNGDNTCWERKGRAIFLRDCDSSNSLQRWFAPNGSFDGEKFEISQKGYERQCVSTAHHPKAGEVVEMHSCVALRAPDSQSSYWNKA